MHLPTPIATTHIELWAAKRVDDILQITVAMSDSRRQLLLVEDERSLRSVLKRGFLRLGFQVTEAGDGSEAQEILGKHPDGYFNLVVSDVHMPQVNGIELLEWLADTQPQLPVIMMSGMLDSSVAARLEALGAAEILPKPFPIAELHATALRIVTAGARTRRQDQVDVG